MGTPTQKIFQFGKSHNWHFAQSELASEASKSIRSEIADALKNPVDFPPLHQAILESDKVAMAVCGTGQFINQIIAEIATQIAEILTEGDVFAVIPENSFSTVFDGTNAGIEDPIFETVKLKKHSHGNREAFAYLGPDSNGEPILANRDLVECDFIIPIVLLESGREPIELQFARQFAEQASGFSLGENDLDPDSQCRMARELIRSMGLFFGVLVKTSPTGSVDSIDAGSWPSLVASAEKFVASNWRIEPTESDVLVATIENEAGFGASDAVNHAICIAEKACPSGEIVLLDLMSDNRALFDLDNELTDEARQIISRRRLHCFAEEEAANVWEQLGFGCTNDLDDLLNWLAKFNSVNCIRNIHLVQAPM